MLVGAMSWCGNKECDCWVPVILDTAIEGAQSKQEKWRGEFLEHPTSEQKQKQRESLADKAKELGATVIADLVYDGS
jgi:hypothetical protein